MFEIPNDDPLWDDDFPLDDLEIESETKPTSNDKPLELDSLSARDTTQIDFVQEFQRQKPKIKDKTTPFLHAFNTDRPSPKKLNSSLKAPTDELTNACKRKFPGPAGVLPPYSALPDPDKLLHDTPDVTSQTGSPAVGKLNDKPTPLPWSQTPADGIFTSPQWLALEADLGEQAQTVLGKFSIRAALLKANRKLLHRGKIPLIVGVMDSFEMQGSDASFVLRDPSGKMNGALHRDLFKDPTTALLAGSVLVLRQVSVISPSSRTHYLNITPANIVLIYTSSRDAVVSKRPWCASPFLTTDAELPTQDSEIQLLHRVVGDSEQELSDYLENFHKRLTTSGSLGVGGSVLNSGSSAGCRPTFSPSGLQNHGQNIMSGSGSSNNLAVKSSLFTSASSSSRPMQKSRNLSETFHSLSTSVRNFGHPVHKHIAAPARSSPGYSFVSNQNKSACNISGGTSSIPNLHNRSDTMLSLRQNLLPVSPATGYDETQNNIVRNNYEIRPNVCGFSEDFPDTDDQWMTQMCDEILTPESTEGQSSHTIGVLDDRQEGYRGCARMESMSPSIISKVFDDCRNENERLINIFESVNCYKTDSQSSHRENNKLSAGNSSIHLNNVARSMPVAETCHNVISSSIASSFVRKFSFKRSQPSSHMSLTPTTGKRPMLDVANKMADSHMTCPFISKLGAPQVNSCLISSVENCENVGRNSVSAEQTLQSDMPTMPLTVSAVKPAISGQSVPGVKHSTSVLSVNPSANNSNSMFSHGDDRNPERCLQITPARKSFDCPSTDRITSLFPHWDDDLNDDFILSQLSDEF